MPASPWGNGSARAFLVVMYLACRGRGTCPNPPPLRGCLHCWVEGKIRPTRVRNACMHCLVVALKKYRVQRTKIQSLNKRHTRDTKLTYTMPSYTCDLV